MFKPHDQFLQFPVIFGSYWKVLIEWPITKKIPRGVRSWGEVKRQPPPRLNSLSGWYQMNDDSVIENQITSSISFKHLKLLTNWTTIVLLNLTFFSMLNIMMLSTLCWVLLCWVLLCWALLCWVLLCWVLLCWMSFRQLSWHPCTA